MRLSVVIITYNEEKNIVRCIESVQAIADEIVVVDSHSSDATHDLAKQLGAKVIPHDFEGHIEQKNWARKQAAGKWILSLDADEAMDQEAIASVLDALSAPVALGYTFNRMTNYCGQWIKHGGWYPDKKLRLWQRDTGEWTGTNPHDRFVLNEGKHPVQLKGHILHYSIATEAAHDEQIAYFTDISAQALHQRGKQVSVFRPFIAAIAKFIRDYLLRLGFLDGNAGYTIARKSAYAKFLKYAKLRQLNRVK